MRLESAGDLRRTSPLAGALRVGLIALCLLASVGLSRQAAGGERTGKARVKLVVGDPGGKSKSENAEFERKKLEEMTNIAAKRLRKRLEAAQIKQYTVTVDKPRTIHVSALGGVSHALLAGIVVPQGDFELRPAMPIGSMWLRHAGELPDGVEIRQEQGSLSNADAHLWSHSRRALQKAIELVSVEGYDVKAYPDAGGWRTLALGAPVATHADVGRARIRLGKMGESYVRVMFEHDIAAQLPHRTRRMWAVVLDGEVVSAFGRADEDFGSALSVTAPEHLSSKASRRAWAQQVAGRLAAHISVPLVEMTAE